MRDDTGQSVRERKRAGWVDYQDQGPSTAPDSSIIPSEGQSQLPSTVAPGTVSPVHDREPSPPLGYRQPPPPLRDQRAIADLDVRLLTFGKALDELGNTLFDISKRYAEITQEEVGRIIEQQRENDRKITERRQRIARLQRAQRMAARRRL